MSFWSKTMRGIARGGIAVYNGANYLSNHQEVVATAAAINPAAAAIIAAATAGVKMTGDVVKATKEQHGQQPTISPPPQTAEGVRGDGQEQAAGDRLPRGEGGAREGNGV